MIAEYDLTPLASAQLSRNATIPVDVFLQGGGRRGAATAGFMVGLLGYPEIEIRAISGTSAGGMVGAVVADGLAKEILHPERHDRQKTRAQTANLFKIVSEYQPYNWLSSLAKQTTEMVSHGQQAMLLAPFAAFNPEGFQRSLKVFSTDIGAQFKLYQQALTRPFDLQHVQFGNKHPLELVLQDAISNTRTLNNPAAPLLVVNAVKVATGEHVLFHNRHADHALGLKHIAATGALSAYLPTIHVPHIGECRDGAEGGANPAIKEFYALTRVMDLPQTPRIAIVYNLSSPDDHLAEEMKARDPKLHGHFLAAMAKQKADLSGLAHDPATRHIQVHKIDAALTREQRAESLSDTTPSKLRAMFEIGLRQGQELAERLIEQHAPTPQRRHTVTPVTHSRPAMATHR